jgi:SAM-dependent methyltransferase
MNNEQIASCLLCGGNAVLRDENRQGYQAPEIFRIYECLDCNTSFSLPRVETVTLYENIYKNGSDVPGYDRYWKYMKAVKKASKPLEYLAEVEDIYWSVKEALNSLVKEKKAIKILEIGSGLGYLTYSLIDAGYNVLGLDISQTAVTQANEIFGNHYICTDLFEYAQLHSESYDIVILSEVIEHVDKPLDFVDSILKLLKHGGSAIITTPNKSLFPSDIIWNTENPPVHCWWFSEDSMKFIAKSYQVSIDFINLEGFYKKKYTSYNLDKIRSAPQMPPILDENGNLIYVNHKQSLIWNSTRLFLSKMPTIKKTLINIRSNFLRVKESSNPKILVCGKRGVILCGILKKSTL